MKKKCPYCDGEYYEAHMFGHVLECGRMSPELREIIRDLKKRPTSDAEERDQLRGWEILGNREDPDAIPTLIAALKNDSYEVRWRAAEALGKIGYGLSYLGFQAESDEPLLSRHYRADPRAFAAVPALINTLKDEAAEAAEAADVLDQSGGVWRPTRDPKLLVRREAAFALAQIGEPASISTLIDVIQNTSQGHDLADALDLVINPAATPVLIEALNHCDICRSPAAEALGRIGDPAAIPALANVLKGSHLASDDARLSIVTALGSLGRMVGTTMGTAPSDRWIKEAIEGEAIPVLIDSLKDENERVRRSAAKSLGDIGVSTGEVVPALIDLIIDDDENHHVRRYSVVALGKIGDPAAIPALSRLLSRFSRLKYFIARAIERIEISSGLKKVKKKVKKKATKKNLTPHQKSLLKEARDFFKPPGRRTAPSTTAPSQEAMEEHLRHQKKKKKPLRGPLARKKKKKIARKKKKKIAKKKRLPRQALRCPTCGASERHPTEDLFLIYTGSQGKWAQCLVCAGYYDEDLNENESSDGDEEKGWFKIIL